MSRRARQRQHARPWESPDALSTGPDDDDDQQDCDYTSADDPFLLSEFQTMQPIDTFGTAAQPQQHTQPTTQKSRH